MPNPVEMFLYGGLFTYVVALFAALHALLCLAQFVTASRINIMPLLWSMLLVTLFAGLLGTTAGLVQAAEAVAFADPENKQAMAAAGLSVSLYTTCLALMWLCPGTLGNGIAGSLVKNLNPDKA